MSCPSVIERIAGLQFCWRVSFAVSRWLLFFRKIVAGAFFAVKGEALSVAWAGLHKSTEASKAPPNAVLKLNPLIGIKCVSEACCKMNGKLMVRSWWALTGSNR
ncbi:hypothetical protein [Sphingorhabdus sp.]|uniref:hypothetical protein n=1 Tax=Sphingorhabdus sp. TaxID=1902408 RepID=UPI0032B71ABB